MNKQSQRHTITIPSLDLNMENSHLTRYNLNEKYTLHWQCKKAFLDRICNCINTRAIRCNKCGETRCQKDLAIMENNHGVTFTHGIFYCLSTVLYAKGKVPPDTTILSGEPTELSPSELVQREGLYFMLETDMGISYQPKESVTKETQ